MLKKNSFFQNLFKFSKQHPLMVLGIIYVTLMPAIGSVLFISYLIPNHEMIQQIPILQINGLVFYTLLGALAMGLAMIPTTLFTAASGFLFGWEVFGLLLIAYLLANIIGYLLGKKVDDNLLEIIKGVYPRMKNKLENKSKSFGNLIFFVRISPIIPFALSNLLFAIIKTGLKKVVLYGTLGMLPRTILSFYSGILAANIWDAINNKGFDWSSIAIMILLVVSAIGILRFFLKEDQEQL
jgi:uncharacterized membrane protein YdjX (TVP38/TMEM64 family)